MSLPENYLDQFCVEAEGCPELCCHWCDGSGSIVDHYEEDVECPDCNGTGWKDGYFPFDLAEDANHGPQEVR